MPPAKMTDESPQPPMEEASSEAAPPPAEAILLAIRSDDLKALDRLVTAHPEALLHVPSESPGSESESALHVCVTSGNEAALGRVYKENSNGFLSQKLYIFLPTMAFIPSTDT